MNRTIISLALCAILPYLLIGCASRAPESYYNETANAPMAARESQAFRLSSEPGSYSYDIDYSVDESVMPQTMPGTGVETPSQRQKIILEAELRMATDRFDEVSTRIRNIAVENNGYVQNSQQYIAGDQMRRLEITIRVPYEQYEFSVAQMKELGALRSASERQHNATEEYYDIQSRLQTKRIEEERLLALIDRTERIEDILELESLLGQVRTQIEVYQTQMTNIDRLASYSTIHVYLDEVIDETTVIIPTNLSGRIYENFIQSVNITIRFMQGALIFLVRISVPLFVLLVAAAIIWGLFQIRRGVARRRQAEKNK